MFKSYKYLGWKYDSKSKQYNFNYKIIDSEFTCESSAAITTPLRATREARVKCSEAGIFFVFIKEYEKRKIPVIQNLFLLNHFFLTQIGYSNVPRQYKTHLKFLFKNIDYYFPEAQFNNKYYEDIIKYTNKMMILI